MASSSSNFPPQPAILSRAPTRNSNPFPGLSSGDAGPPEDNCVNHDALASLTLGRSHGAESSMAALDAEKYLDALTEDDTAREAHVESQVAHREV